MDADLLHQAWKKVISKGDRTKWETFEQRVIEVRKELIQAARGGDVRTYKELACEVDTDEQKHLAIYLRGLNWYCKKRSEPPLSVLAVNKDLGRPSAKFFEQMEELGLYDPSSETEDEAFERLKREVHGFY